jgi:hypothetical protein
MVTLGGQINAPRRGVTVYPSPPRQAAPPPRRATPKKTVDKYDEIDAQFMAAPDVLQQRAAEAQKQAQQKARDNAPLWSKALTVALAPLQPLSVPLKAVTLGLEEGVKLLPDSIERRMSKPFGDNPDLQLLNQLAPLAGGVLGQDMAKTHDDESWWDRIKPSSDYGSGAIYQGIDLPFATGARNLALDITHDPLTFLTPGAGKLTELGTRAAKEVSAAREALEQAPKFLDDAGKVANPAIKDLETALARAETAATKAGRGTRIKDLPLSRQGRMGMISELAASGPEGEALVKQFSNEFAKGVDVGFNRMPQAAKDALGITKSGLRVRGTNAIIPGTGKLAEVANLPGQAVRSGFAKLGTRLEGSGSGILSKLGEGRVPVALGEAYRTVRSKSSTPEQRALALAEINAETLAHTTQNIVHGGANNVATKAARPINKMSKAAQAALVDEAERSPTPNLLNVAVNDMAQVFADSTGRDIRNVVVKDSATYLPHIQTDEWFEFRKTLSDEAKRDWDNLTGITTTDTLKTSGHMDKRALQVLPGETKSFKIGDRMVAISDDTIGGKNKAFAEAFPEFKGKVYEDDPRLILQGYAHALGQDSRLWSLESLGDTGTSFFKRNTGDLAAEQQALNETMALQPEEARIAAAANEPRVAGQRAPEVGGPPIVPHSERDVVAAAIHEQAPTLRAQAQTPDQIAQLEELLGQVPQPTGVPNSGVFKRVESSAAQQRLADQLLSPEALATERALREEAVAAGEASGKVLADVRQNLFNEVRADAKDVEKKLATIDKGIKSYKTQLEGFRSVRSNNPATIQQMLESTTKNVVDLEAELAKKQATWKGLGTKAANKAERKLKDQLEELRKIRDETIDHLSEATGKRVSDEVAKRTEALYAPVRAAEERLAAKTASIPAPYNRRALENAHDALAKAGLTDDAWQAYDQVIAQRPRNTPLAVKGAASLADQRTIDLAAHQITGAPVTPYIEAQGRAAALERMIPDASPSTAARMRRELAEINKDFNPGGKFYGERKARAVMARQLEHEQTIQAATARERATLDRVRQETMTRQEAVIKDRGGEVVGETFGLDSGETRKVGRPGPVAGEGRSERQAIAALQSQMDPGSPLHHEVVAKTTQDVAAFEADMARMTGNERAAALRDIGAQADVVLGPISAKLQTMKSLTTDLGNKQQLLSRREVNGKLLAGLAKGEIGKADLPPDLLKAAEALRSVVRQNPRLDDLSLAATESLLHNEIEQLTLATEKLNYARSLANAQAAARSGELPKVFVAALHDNWVTLHGGLVKPGDTIVDKELFSRFMRVTEAVNDPKLFTRTFNNLTNLWKTYATLSPGFHVRNGLGGIFMNLSDGVGFTHQLEAIDLFKQLRSGGPEWLRNQDERVQQAVKAMFASGAGGQFEEAGMRTGLANNFLARKSRKAGEWVEGPLRLAMSLHSYDQGDTLLQTYERINRVHFDYSRVSRMDESMKRIIPFWTFMSRNLPLQVTQIYAKPQAYAYYESVKRNFSVPNDPLTPEYWGRLGAWNTGLEFKGMPLYLDADFGFNRLESDIGTLQDVLGGNPGALLSNVNPLLSAPADFLAKRDSFYDRSYKDTDFSEQSGLFGTPLKVLANLIPGQTNPEGQVSDNFTNLVRSLIPVYDRGVRLSGEADPQRAPESWARFFGAPVRTLSDKQRQTAALSRYLDAKAEQTRRRAAAREAG